MVGGKGKGKASAGKSKRKVVAFVPPVAEPLNIEESADGPLDGVEKNIENSNRDESSTDVKERDDTTCGEVVGNQLEEQHQLLVEGDDEEKDPVNELNDDQVDAVPMSGEMENNQEEANDGGDVMENVDTEEGENSDEEDPEEVNDDDGAANNVEDNGQKTDEELAEEDKEPMHDCFDGKAINNEEENMRSGEDAEGKIVISEGFAVSEHGTMGEKMSNDLQNEQETHKLNAEERVGSLADGSKIECGGEDASFANEVKATPEKANKSKGKLLKKKVVRKKMAKKNDVVSMIEVKPQSSLGNDTSGEANLVESNEHGMNEQKLEVKRPVLVNKKLNRKMKKVSQNNAGIAAVNDGQETKPADIEPGNEVYKVTTEQELNHEKPGKCGDTVSGLKKKRSKQNVMKDDKGNVVSGDITKPGPSRKSKSSKKIETMGMIFMCSSETKKDCYHYKVLGLPAGKKDVVLKIYEGMRLFLFDVDLRMMYGIYKAAGPGGYNIEPKAFKSQFPSQVRFKVLEDCVPLAEENFKRVIKDNYYTKNKFNFQLNSEQVKNLCKLFHDTTKRADSKRIGKNLIAAAPSSVRRDRKRKRAEDSRKTKPVSSSKRVRNRRPAGEEVRHGPVLTGDRYYMRPVVYEREAYLPPTAPAVLYQPLPARSPPRSASYGRASRVDLYRRDSPLGHRELGLPSVQEFRHPPEPDRREPYASYRETRSYHEPAYETGARRDHYETGSMREHYDYSSVPGRVEYYRSAEYRPPLPPYRRY